MGQQHENRYLHLADTIVEINRVINAPRRLVWNTITSPECAKSWWAPTGSTVTRIEMDVHPRGEWRKCMLLPDGHEVCNGGVYRKIAVPELLEFTYDVHGNETQVSFKLIEIANKTKLTLCQSPFGKKADRDSHLFGWTSTIERLSKLINQPSTNT